MYNLFKKLLRDIKSNKGQFIAISIVIFLGSCLYTGFNSTTSDLREYADSYYSDYNLADLWAYYAQIDKDKISEIKDIDGVDDAEGRYMFDAKYTSDDVENTLRIQSLSDKDEMNKPYIVKGHLPKKTNDLVIDRRYAESHDLSVGDKLKIKINDKEVTEKICGIINDVEYLEILIDDYAMVPDSTKYGIGYFSEDLIADLYGENTVKYNEVLIKSDSNTTDLKETLEDETKDYSYLYAATRENNRSYSDFENQIEQFKNLSTIFPVLFFTISAVIIFITMTKLVDSQRNQIGILKALGIHKGKILFHYLQYPCIIGFFSSIIGSLVGSIYIPKFMIGLIEGSYNLTEIETKLYFYHIAPSVGLAIVFGIIATYLSCRKTLKEDAATAMRPKAPKLGKKILLEKNKKLWNKFADVNKIILRNIFTNKSRAILSSLGIIGSVSLLICGFGLKNTVNTLFDKQFGIIYKYDLKINYSSNIDDEDKLDLPKNIDYKATRELPFEVNDNDITTHGTIVVLNDADDFISIINKDYSSIDLDDDGVIISERLSQKYNLSVGDNFDVKIIDPNYNGKVLEDAKVQAISTQFLTQDIYCTSDFLKDNDIDYKPNALFVKVDNKDDLDDVSDYFKDEDEVDHVFLLSETKDTMINVSQSTNSIVAFLTLSSLLLAFAVIYNISSINIFERQRMLATLKVLGFRNKNVNKLIFSENFLLSIMGIIVGIPVGLQLLKYILLVSTTDKCNYPFEIDVFTIVIPIVLTIVFTYISNFALRNKVKKINMVESLKIRE